jgi:hypothetical protein
MSELQHQRIEELCPEPRLAALPWLGGPIAQAAAKKKDVSMPISWRRHFAPNASPAGHARARC